MRSLTGAAQPGMPSPTRSAAYVASALIPGSWANPHPHNYNLQDFPGFVLPIFGRSTIGKNIAWVERCGRLSERNRYPVVTSNIACRCATADVANHGRLIADEAPGPSSGLCCGLHTNFRTGSERLKQHTLDERQERDLG